MAGKKQGVDAKKNKADLSLHKIIATGGKPSDKKKPKITR